MVEIINALVEAIGLGWVIVTFVLWVGFIAMGIYINEDIP